MPMRKYEPSAGARRLVFLPIHPSPARAARSRSSTALVSTATRVVACPSPAAVADEGGEALQPRPHHLVVVAAPRVARHRRPGRIVLTAVAVAQRHGHHRARARKQAPRIEPIVAVRAPGRPWSPRSPPPARPRRPRRAPEATPVRWRPARSRAPRPRALTAADRAIAVEVHRRRAFTTRWARVSVRPPSSRNLM